ncbi:MAG: aromatic-ring-hydroxylating dioxygenase subunit beta [Alicyclobacillus sp.]|nr:aromatic-ring-hydroxylating dioxygenase subunit beta [Alicyclobacillus sp.]
MELSAAKATIADLLTEYVHCIDDDRLEEWPDFFTEKCLYQVISRENYQRSLPMTVIYCDSRAMLKDRIQSLREANVYEMHWYRHILCGTRIVEENEGIYTAHTNYVVFRTTLEGSTELYNTGKYIDKVTMVDGRPKFLEKNVVFDTLRVSTLLVIPL